MSAIDHVLPEIEKQPIHGSEAIGVFPVFDVPVIALSASLSYLTTHAPLTVLNMMLLSILPASGVGIAAATLVGSALGRGDVADAERWGWEVARLGALGILAFSLIVVMAPRSYGRVLGLPCAAPARPGW